jgi:hypothetical protein
MIRQRMQNGVAHFYNAQILSLARTKFEVFIENNEFITVHLGKSWRKAQALEEFDNLHTPVYTSKSGNYFYLYTIPLVNYYHMLLDSVGCLTRYLELKQNIPDLKLLVNQSPKTKGGVFNHPPFVSELLELLDIEYEFTDEHCAYENLYFGDTQGNDSNGRRIRPANTQYKLLQRCIQRAQSRVTTPKFEKIYLSRRAHANPLNNRKDVIGEDNTVKRGLTNEDEVVEILAGLGYTEVFGENYSLAEKIVLFNGMKKYISTAGAGVANILWTMPNSVSVGGIHTPGFPFPSNNHERHICCNKQFVNATINVYPGKVLFVDPEAGAKNYNNPWYINNLVAFRNWAETI